jgi:hypothetical protein
VDFVQLRDGQPVRFVERKVTDTAVSIVVAEPASRR